MLKKNFLVTTSLFILCAALTLNAPRAYAGEPFPNEMNDLPTTPDIVILPSPASLMNALHSFGKKVYLPEPMLVNSTNKLKLSLNIGILIADSVACVKEKNQQKLLKNAELLYKYGKAVELDHQIMGMFDSVYKDIKLSKWIHVQAHMNRLRDYMNESLQKNKYVTESKLANSSGWIEGLYIAGKTLEKDFNSEQASQILRYKNLPSYLKLLVDSLPEEAKNLSEVELTKTTLEKLNAIISTKTSFSKEDLDQINAITSEYRSAVMK